MESLVVTADYDLCGNQMLGFFRRQNSIERPLTSSRQVRSPKKRMNIWTVIGRQRIGIGGRNGVVGAGGGRGGGAG